MGSCKALLAAIGIALSVAACGPLGFAQHPAQRAVPPAPAVFRVTGSAPTGVWIQIGSDNYTASGDHTALPWRKKIPGARMPRATYYELIAQVHGEADGQITCSISAHGVTKHVPASGSYASCHVLLRLQGGHWVPEKF